MERNTPQRTQYSIKRNVHKVRPYAPDNQPNKKYFVKNMHKHFPFYLFLIIFATDKHKTTNFMEK